MKVNSRTGGAIVAAALVFGGGLAYAQTSGSATAAGASPSASPSSSPSVAASSPSASASSTPSATRSVAAKPSPSAAPSRSATPAPTKGGTGNGLVLSTTHIGSLALPAKADDLVATLTPILGKPTRNDVGEGCKVNGTLTKSRTVNWGENLHFFGHATNGGEISSWLVYGSKSPVPIEYPYGVGLGTTLRDAQAKIPGAVGGKDVHGYPTLKKGKLTWSFLDFGPDTTVNAVEYYAFGCD